MKRSEILEHIETELKEFIETYNHSSEKAKSHKIKSAADKILSMLEGFGMLPPKNYNYNTASELRTRNDMAYWEPSHEWESEDETK